jgi:hypothetical protein
MFEELSRQRDRNGGQSIRQKPNARRIMRRPLRLLWGCSAGSRRFCRRRIGHLDGKTGSSMVL